MLLVERYVYPEDEARRFLRNVCTYIYLPDYMASHLGRQLYSLYIRTQHVLLHASVAC